MLTGCRGSAPAGARGVLATNLLVFLLRRLRRRKRKTNKVELVGVPNITSRVYGPVIDLPGAILVDQIIVKIYWRIHLIKSKGNSA